MAISEKKIIPLSIDKCDSFKPKREKEKEITLEKQNLQIDLNLIEEDVELLKLRDMPRRKSSSGSTSVSKQEDASELLSIPDSPVSTPLNSQQSGIFFGRDRNCSNPIFNFYQNTEEHLRETYPEYEKYKKTKNYLSKNNIIKKNEISEIKTIVNNSKANNTDNSTQNNNVFKNSLPTTSVAAVMGAFTPNICSGGKGKFDLPMYYVGFYGWDTSNGIPIIPFTPKELNKKTEKTLESNSDSNEENSQKEKKNESNIKPHENMEPTMMIGTPIFFSNMPKYCYNKLYKRKQKPFTEREGDWICNHCKNLNFAFRLECNRCKLPKGADTKVNNVEETNKENNQDQKPYQRNSRYNKHKKNYNYYYYNNKNNINENGKE